MERGRGRRERGREWWVEGGRGEEEGWRRDSAWWEEHQGKALKEIMLTHMSAICVCHHQGYCMPNMSPICVCHHQGYCMPNSVINMIISLHIACLKFHTHIHLHTSAYTHLHTHICLHTSIPTYTHPPTHICLHTSIPTYTHIPEQRLFVPSTT